MPIEKQKDFVDRVCQLIISKYSDFDVEEPFTFEVGHIIKMKQDILVYDILNDEDVKLKKGELLLFLYHNSKYFLDMYNLILNFDIPVDYYKGTKIIYYDPYVLGDYIQQFNDDRIEEYGIFNNGILTAVSIDKYIKSKYNVDLTEIKKQRCEYKDNKIKNEYENIINGLIKNFDDNHILKVGERKTLEAYPDYMPENSYEQDYDVVTPIFENEYLLEHYVYNPSYGDDAYILTKGVISQQELKHVEEYWDMLLTKNELEYESILISSSKKQI